MLQSIITKKPKILTTLFSICVVSSFASMHFYANAEQADVVYYSEAVRQIDISSIQSMLLIFPEAPFGVSCQGDSLRGKEERLVDIKPPDDNSSFDQLATSGSLSNVTGNLYNGLPNKVDSSQKNIAQDLLSKRLLLTPLRKSGVATCTFELSNQDSFTVEFHLSRKVIRPAIEFKNLYQNTKKASMIVQSIGGLNLFKVLISGNDVSFLSDMTPGQYNTLASTWNTSSANYKFEYIGTDKSSFKAWRINAKLKKNISNFQLSPKSVGDLYYSTVLNENSLSQKESYKKGEYVRLYVLSRADFQSYEMEALLP